MKDFDFDELDRAVNSVLATKDTKTDATADPATTDAPQQIVQDADQTDDNGPVVVQNTVEDAQPHEVTETTDDSNDVSNEEHSEADHTSDQTSTVVEESDLSEVSEGQHEEHDHAQQDVDHDHHTESDNSDSGAEDHEEETSHEEGGDTDSGEKPEDASAHDTHTTSLAAIPVKRGRFMDMVAPGTGLNDGSKKPLPTRGGVTLAPSSDFVATETSHTEDASPLVQEPSQTDVATPLVESEVELEPVAVSTDEQPVTDDLPSSDTDTGDKGDDVANVTDSLQDVSIPAEPHTDTPPFIPDVPVEKRPLNALSGTVPEASEQAQDNDHKTEEDLASAPDPTLSATAPKEFDKDIMAVEANETVGTQAESATPADAQNDTSAPAITATGAEPHPMFDTSTLAHPGTVATHHTSKMSWAIVGVSLFIVGAALGVLYFLYGQG